MSIAARITEVRTTLGWSKRQLASMVGVTPTAVGQWERGNTKNLKNEFLFKLERATGYSAKWFVTGRGPKMAGETLSEDALVLIDCIMQMNEADRLMVEQMILRLAELEQSPK